MINGESWSRDHCHKVTKATVSCGSRVCGAFYSLVNPHGQVIGWWFMNGMCLDEVKGCAQKLMHRCDTHGFAGPFFVNTDRCCNEQSCWKQNLHGHALADAIEDCFDEEDQEKELELVLPQAPTCSHSAAFINAKAGETSSCLDTQPKERKVVAVDCEWKIGNKKADVVQLGLFDGRTFVFQISHMSSFPAALKSLPENKAVAKTGN